MWRRPAAGRELGPCHADASPAREKLVAEGDRPEGQCDQELLQLWVFSAHEQYKEKTLNFTAYEHRTCMRVPVVPLRMALPDYMLDQSFQSQNLPPSIMYNMYM